MLKFIIAVLLSIGLFCNTSSAAVPDLTTVVWKKSAPMEWAKKAEDGTTYVVQISPFLGVVYGTWIACPPGSVNENDVTIIVTNPKTGAESQVLRIQCDGTDGVPNLHLEQWKAIVGDLPEEVVKFLAVP